MKNKVAFELISIIRKTNLIDTIREVYGKINKLNEEKENIWVSLRAQNLKKINDFEKSISDLDENEKKSKSDIFYDSLVDDKSRLKLEDIDRNIQDQYWIGIEKALVILDGHREDFYKFIATYKDMSIEDVENADLELTIGVINEVINDKSFLSLMKLLKK
ncbi:Uncharacterised protein [uncultured Clostridium sp.]|nr:Uncharacterised protein [uncultured Clostridium sp.]SCJ50114.1 Uncharacterised protein [uncultured Clostridium sp.]